MVLASDYRHMPLGTLARYAQRIGKVFASVTTWAKLVRERGWRRPRQRLHPLKPTVGVRASRPNEIWHVDTTVIKLVDGSKVYLQAVVDNFSRKILAWAVTERFDPSHTCQVLLAAGKHLVDAGRPLLYADSGVENVNGAVDATLFSACLERILAQVEVGFSNSIVEAYWRSLKHQWLFMNTLDTVAHVRALERMVLLGEWHLRKAISEYMKHYHAERNHQGLDNTLIDGISPDTDGIGPVARRERLGGLLGFYYREAA